MEKAVENVPDAQAPESNARETAPPSTENKPVEETKTEAKPSRNNIATY